jgi:hypothetical protein
MAAWPSVEIEAKYSGFDPALLGKVDANSSGPGQTQVMHSVAIASGRRAVMDIGTHIKVPGQPEPIDAGVVVEVSAKVQGNQVTLTGKSTVRHFEKADGAQPFGVVSFKARETYFSGTVDFGMPFVIRVGDGPADNAEIDLVAKQGPAPTLRLTKLNATADDLDKFFSAAKRAQGDYPFGFGRNGPPVLHIDWTKPATAQTVEAAIAREPGLADLGACTSEYIDMLRSALGGRIGAAQIEKQGFKVAVAPGAETYLAALTITSGGKQVSATLWDGESELLAARDPGSPDGEGFYLLTLNLGAVAGGFGEWHANGTGFYTLTVD